MQTNRLPARLVSAWPALKKGRRSRSSTAGAGRQEHAAALRWKRDGHSITSSVRARKRCPNPCVIMEIVDYAAETTERRIALGSRRGSHDEERRYPLLNTRRSYSAVSAPRRQAGARPPFCSHGYERAFPEPNPVRRLAGTSRPAIQRDGGAMQGK